MTKTIDMLAAGRLQNMHARTCMTIGTGLITLALLVAPGALPEARGATAYWTGVNGGYWSDVTGNNWSSTAASPGTPYTPVNGDTLEWRGNFGINKVSTNDLGSLTTVAAINMYNSNPDGVVLNGSNTLTLTGRDFVKGDGSGSNTINLPLDLAYSAGAPILYGATGSGLLTLNGVITGTNGISLSSGTAALYGANSLSGNWLLQSTLYINTLANTNTAQSLGKSASIQFGHNSGSCTLIYNGTGGSTDRKFQISRALSTATGTGAFINNGSGAVVWSGTQTKATANTNLLIFTLGGTNAADNTWQSVIDNNSAAGLIGIAKIDNGKWILSGSNTYDGGTTVSNGTLLIDGNQSGATGAVTVSGGTLGGTGTVGGVVSVAAGAALAPGHAGIGTLTITGAVTLAEGAVYKWDCQTETGDLVALTGANGTLTLPTVATVQVTQVSGGLPSPATLFTATSLAGATDLSRWTVSGINAGTVKIEGTSVILKAGASGTLLSVR